ncbi:MAG: histone H1 [Boseongicola sp. SB0667_bin_21]|nr:histone H1 [Boseongicola sp. SB0667_bin_21]
MNSAPKRPRDANQLGKLVVDFATGQVEDEAKTVDATKRKAGLAGGAARSAAMSPAKRKQIARAGAAARWNKHVAAE